MMKLWIICLAHHKEIGSKMEIKDKGRWRDPGGEAEAGGGLLGDGRQRQRQVEGCRWGRMDTGKVVSMYESPIFSLPWKLA